MKNLPSEQQFDVAGIEFPKKSGIRNVTDAFYEALEIDKIAVSNWNFPVLEETINQTLGRYLQYKNILDSYDMLLVPCTGYMPPFSRKIETEKIVSVFHDILNERREDEGVEDAEKDVKVLTFVREA